MLHHHHVKRDEPQKKYETLAMKSDPMYKNVWPYSSGSFCKKTECSTEIDRKPGKKE